jgi:hypothetical protein
LAYHIIAFGDVPIPILNPAQDHSPARGQSSSIAVIGGYYDTRGDRPALPQLQSISVSGLIWGETEYLIDETGDFIVDETGDFVIAGSGVQMLRAQLDALAEVTLRRGTLWRKRFDDEGRQWKTARFLELSYPQTVEDRLFKAEVSLTFETRMCYWHAENYVQVAGSAFAGATLPLPIENTGQQAVSDPRLQFTCSFGTITSILMTSAALGISLSWQGSLSTGEVLILECGEEAIATGAEDAFANLRMEAGHTIAGWLLLPLGPSTLNILVSGGNAGVSLVYYNQFA